MRILHTSDWHVGRAIRGRSRDDEHRAVLAEITSIARDREVDLVLVAGDIFDSASPSPQAEEIVYEALLELAGSGTQVVLIAGNHDNPGRLKAVQPLLRLAHVHALGDVAQVDDGGCIEVRAKSGETAKVAMIPWVSQRRVVTAAHLMAQDAGDNVRLYSAQYRVLVEHLAQAFTPKSVNVVMAHVAAPDAEMGGGERSSQTIFDYWVPTNVFPVSAQYVALGHIHRQQQMPHAIPVWYSGSPLQLDFGEGTNRNGVLLVEAKPGVPATVEQLETAAGKQLLSIKGTFDQVVAQGKALPDAYLRVLLDEPQRAGLSDELRAELPNAVDIRLIRPFEDQREQAPPDTAGLSYQELFARYLEERHIVDERVQRLFDELLEEAHATAPA
ncbi:MAG: exonuclease SbcCD subunit D [Hyphomicrobiales bacterium]